MGPFTFWVCATEIQVRIGPWVVRRVALADIARVDVAGYRQVPIWNEHWCNFTPARFVVLRRKSGWVRNFVINPKDTTEFLSALHREAPGIEQG
ncbi:MAG TPA: hypothetical protein VEP50_09885 [bacterium]|nr:hypothetical protein [bacterium]